MSIAIWKPGRRLFSTAAILMLLTAAAHTAGNLAARQDSPEEQQAFAAMRALEVPLGIGMVPSLEDIYWSLVYTMSITFAALGLLNLVVAASPDLPHGVLRSLSWVNALWVGVFLVLNFKQRIPPPLISGVLIEVFVVASLLVKDKAKSA